MHFIFIANSELEHFIIRTNLVAPQEFELTELHSNNKGDNGEITQSNVNVIKWK